MSDVLTDWEAAKTPPKPKWKGDDVFLRREHAVNVAGDALAAEVTRLRTIQDEHNDALGRIHVANHDKAIATRLAHEEDLKTARRAALTAAAGAVCKYAQHPGPLDLSRWQCNSSRCPCRPIRALAGDQP